MEENLPFGIVREDKGILKGIRKTHLLTAGNGGDRAPNKDPMLEVEPGRARRKAQGGGIYRFGCQPFVSEAKLHLLPAAYPWLKSQVRLQVWRHFPEASFPSEPSLAF